MSSGEVISWQNSPNTPFRKKYTTAGCVVVTNIRVTKILHTETLKLQLFLLTIKQHMFCFLEKFTQLENFLHFYTTAGHDGRDKFQVCIVVLCLRLSKRKSLFACICQSDFEFSLTTKEINPALNTKNISYVENLALMYRSKNRQVTVTVVLVWVQEQCICVSKCLLK